MMDAFLNLLDSVSWRLPLQLACVFGFLIVAFRMQAAERYDDLIGCNHGMMGWVRRLSDVSIGLILLLLCYYGHVRNWDPQPPGALLVMAIDLGYLVRVIITYQDLWRRSQWRADVRRAEHRLVEARARSRAD